MDTFHSRLAITQVTEQSEGPMDTFHTRQANTQVMEQNEEPMDMVPSTVCLQENFVIQGEDLCGIKWTYKDCHTKDFNNFILKSKAFLEIYTSSFIQPIDIHSIIFITIVD